MIRPRSQYIERIALFEHFLIEQRRHHFVEGVALEIAPDIIVEFLAFLRLANLGDPFPYCVQNAGRFLERPPIGRIEEAAKIIGEPRRFEIPIHH